MLLHLTGNDDNNPDDTGPMAIGYLLCRYRQYGCVWLTRYFLPTEEYTAEEQRRIHELICSFRHHDPELPQTIA